MAEEQFDKTMKAYLNVNFIAYQMSVGRKRFDTVPTDEVLRHLFVTVCKSNTKLLSSLHGSLGYLNSVGSPQTVCIGPQKLRDRFQCGKVPSVGDGEAINN